MPDTDPISLDELAQAFAQVIGPSRNSGAGEEPKQPRTDAVDNGEIRPQSPGEPELEEVEAADDAGPVTPLGILEAMLFVGDRGNSPLTAARAAELMRGVEPGEIAALVQELNRRYAKNDCPYFVTEDSDGYRLTLRKQFHPVRERFLGRIRQARLSQAAIDILAVVAYQQPLTAEQIQAVRGKPSGHVLSQLVHRGLLRIDRLPGKRPTAQYCTTDRFLKLFGLETLADLPQSEELDRQ
jgi:segregation and condensation protein B